MIRIGEKYVRGSAVNAIEPSSGFGSMDPENWSKILVGNDWIYVNAPVAVVVDRIHLDEVCADINCTEVHDG